MPTPLAVNPQDLSFLAGSPYLTISEYKAAPNATGTSNLVEGGNATSNIDQLGLVIARASSWADNLANIPSLGAASLTETARVRVRRDGYVILRTHSLPILEVTTLSLGTTPSSLVALPASAGTDIWFAGRLIGCPAFVSSVNASLSNPAVFGSGPLFAQWTYVAGYPNATLTATAASGATQIVLSSVVGMYAGTTLTIYDTTGGSEQVAVQSIAGLTVTLTSPLLRTHTVLVAPDAISVSALPPSIKQAVICLTNVLIKARGNSAVVMASLNTPGQKQTVPQSSMSDFTTAKGIISSFAAKQL